MLEAGLVSLKSIFGFEKFSTIGKIASISVVDRDMMSFNVVLHVSEK
jgi:hypothetical protein